MDSLKNPLCGPPDLTVPGFGIPIGSAYFRRAEGTAVPPAEDTV